MNRTLPWLAGSLGLLLVTSVTCLTVAFAQDEGAESGISAGEGVELEVDEAAIEAEGSAFGEIDETVEAEAEGEFQLDFFNPEDTATGDSSGFPSLLDTTRAASVLIPPLDFEEETERALRNAGRADPFVSLLPTEEPAPVDLPPLPIDLEPSEAEEVVEVDPAEFARSVVVTGIMQIGSDVFALVESAESIPEMVQLGDRYETATVASISMTSKQVILEEGGQQVTIMVDDEF